MALTISLAALGMVGNSYGVPQISVVTSKPVYTYGESLAFSVTVSNVTGDTATLEIVDQSNRTSSPIDMFITKPVSNITAPVPFYRTTFLPGTYLIKIQYSGASAVTSFQIADSQNIAIPPQFKVVASSWASNQTSDRLFGEHVAELIDSGIIQVENYQVQNMSVIPPWFKNDARWWSSNQIADDDFGHAIEYLLRSGIMKI